MSKINHASNLRPKLKLSLRAPGFNRIKIQNHCIKTLNLDSTRVPLFSSRHNPNEYQSAVW